MMNQMQNFVDALKRDIQRLSMNLEVLPDFVAKGNAAEYSEIAQEAALRSEYITCRMRHFLYHQTCVKKREYPGKAARVQGMCVRAHRWMVEIEIPGLYPSRKKAGYNEFILDPLYIMLEQYTEKCPIKLFETAVICFVHEYDSSLPQYRIMDYDNMEKKRVLDILATYFLVDDGGIFCDTYNTTALGDRDRTRIFIMAPEHFPEWYFGQKAR